MFEFNGVLCLGLYGRPKALQLEEEKAPKFNWGLFVECLGQRKRNCKVSKTKIMHRKLLEIMKTNN